MLLGLLLIPLAGILLISVAPARFATGLALVTFLINLVWGVLEFFHASALPTTSWIFPIISEFGVGFGLWTDAIGWIFVLLTLLFFMLLAVWHVGEKSLFNPKFFWNCLLFLQLSLLGLFLVSDMLMFYLFLELTLLPLALLIGRWGNSTTQNSVEAMLWFLIYTLAGSFLLLASIITMGWFYHAATGVWSFSYWDWYRTGSIPSVWQGILLIGVFFAFAVKLHLFPLHTWLPKVVTSAPKAVNVLLMGFLVSVGTFGFWRMAVYLLPLAWKQYELVLIALAVVGILYSAVVASAQKNIKMVLTFAAISHAGFILLGLALATPNALNGALLQTISDGVNFGVLFLLVAMLADRGVAMSFESLGGLAKQLPNLAGYFLLVSFAVMGLPGLNSFVAEFLILLELFKAHWFWAALASSALIWGAIYMLGLVRQIFWGALKDESRVLRDLSLREHLILLPLVIMIFWLGVCPNFFLERFNQNAQVLENFKNPPVAKVKVVQKARVR